MFEIISSLLFLSLNVGLGYYWYYMHFIFPKKHGVPYIIQFDQVEIAPNIRENSNLKGKIEIISQSPDNLTWEVRSKVINERVIKRTLMDDYNLADRQVHISGEARWAYEYYLRRKDVYLSYRF